MSDREDTKKELRRLVESGGEDALLPRVLLGMMQAQEDTNKRMEELHAQSAETARAQSAELVKAVGENAEIVRAQSAKAEDNTAAALTQMIQSQEERERRDEEFRAQSIAADKASARQIEALTESTQQNFKDAGEGADSARKESAAAEGKTAAALSRLDKKASWGVGLAAAVLVVALAAVALIAWKNFT